MSRLALALALLTTAPALAQSPQTVDAGSALLIPSLHGRETHSLNGMWAAIVDPYETGYRNILTLEPMDPGRRDMCGNDSRVTDPTDCLEYRYPTARRLRVPGD